MVTRRGDQGNRPRATSGTGYYQLLTAAIIISSYLVTSGNCLSAPNAKQSHSDGRVQLANVVSEFEDALSRLKQYAKETERARVDQEDDDPLAESIERGSRDEDYRQEPEIVPGLDRFEKNLDEAAGSSGRAAQKSGGRSTNDQFSERDDLNDISLKDLMEFLRERKSQKNKDHTGQGSSLPDLSSERRIGSGDGKAKTSVKDDSSDVTLKDALEYLATLKKKLTENERTA